ncbi:MAG: nucleotide sugar dehydrogenase [Micrococcaceae bacterium]
MHEDLVVIGLGYVGLPVVKEAINSGLNVVGLDLNQKIVDNLNAGQSHIDDISDDEISEMIKKGFTATSDISCLADTSNIVICVPTPLSKEGLPDLTAVKGAVKAIADHVQPGTLVSLESTTYPGTTEEIVVPILEESGHKIGKDIFVVFSPERIDPGNPKYGLKNTTKIVGGVNEKSTQKGVELYSQFIDNVYPVSGTKEAELTKLLENTYRHINIALVNEMAKFCHDLDINIWDVIQAASTKPFGFQPFFPGAGVGGHCIPIDPNYLSHAVKAKLGYPFRFVELAQEINDSMPEYVASRIQNLLKADGLPLKNSKVLLVGVTYKPNIADQRESPALPLANILLKKEVKISYFDPYVEKWNVNEDYSLKGESNLQDACEKADIVVLLQKHDQVDEAILLDHSKQVFDTTGKLKETKNVTQL